MAPLDPPVSRSLAETLSLQAHFILKLLEIRTIEMLF